jgi:integrase
MADASNRGKLTKPVVAGLKRTGKEYFVWDDKEPGLGVRVRPSGAKTWVFQYRLHNRPLRFTIGNAEAIHPDMARKQAIRLRAQVVEGKSPAAEKAADRQAKTVAELCDDYLKWIEKRPHRPVKPGTLKNDRSRIEAHVKPLLGRKAVKSLDLDAIEKFFQDVADGKSAEKPPAEGEKRKLGGLITGGTGAAHRTVGMLGSILQYAVGKKLLPSNPVFLFKRQVKKKLKPPFDIEAVKRVGAAMRELEEEGEPAVGIRSCRHLLLSGFRRMEGLTFKWGGLDARAHCARLADTKTGAQIRPLGQASIDHLLGFKPRGSEAGDFIFPGDGKEGHFVGLPKVWGRIAKRAGVKGVSIHGLRHWFASAGAELGFSDIIIGAIIGHAKKGTTGIYATAPDSALILAADRISQYLADALDGKQRGQVV